MSTLSIIIESNFIEQDKEIGSKSIFEPPKVPFYRAFRRLTPKT